MKKLVAGNWKLNCKQSAFDMLSNLDPECFNNVESLIAVPYPLIQKAQSTFPSFISVSSQDVSKYNEGAYTGEVGASILKELGVKYTIIGHSERRKYFNETDYDVLKKIENALTNNIKVICCIGESDEEDYLNFLYQQIKNLENKNIDIAYEPTFAIGKKAASIERIRTVISYINIWMDELNMKGRVLYGGSVNGDNAKEISKIEKIGGCLVGGASLTEEFGIIAKEFN